MTSFLFSLSIWIQIVWERAQPPYVIVTISITISHSQLVVLNICISISTPFKKRKYSLSSGLLQLASTCREITLISLQLDFLFHSFELLTLIQTNFDKSNTWINLKTQRKYHWRNYKENFTSGRVTVTFTRAHTYTCTYSEWAH